ncbi:hypothetical protein M5C72_02755 [Companilactobacillus allii]|uniref:Uncharacterized protein n=1 Tax=Companilactobacillus allii TaxID=1847728 RepID=A0A1P8Q2I2_9LACO|nr:hypothetical protein [Companilactobacillus allii]APX72082.1 hypothetical protein BTM29_05670 [Companilactobacillus allii]USQ69175.1 hypothetical protein M5C72_02755 [Companilactobacillus allii]
MSWNNDHIPTVRITAEDEYSHVMTDMASKFKQLGDEELSKSILMDKSRLNTNIPKSVEKIANDEVDGAMRLIKERQYHSKSGYVGHGNLLHSIRAEFKKNGFQADIAPHAMSKNDYEYGQAFEFGLRHKNYPAQHPMRDSGKSLNADKYTNDVINNSIK